MIFAQTSCLCTGMIFGASMPKRTLSPLISTTVTVMSLLITIISFFFLERTSMVTFLSVGNQPVSHLAIRLAGIDGSRQVYTKLHKINPAMTSMSGLCRISS